MDHIRTNRLDHRQTEEVRALQEISLSAEGLSNEPFLSNMFNADKDLPCFFLAYEDGRLVSFLSCFFPSPPEVETNGFTHPQMRRRGYFSALLEQARQTFLSAGYTRFLLQVEPDGVAGKEYVRTRCPEMEMTEYRLCIGRDAWDGAGQTPLALRPVADGTSADLNARISSAIFGMPLAQSRDQTQTIIDDPTREAYLCYREDTPVGIVNLHYESTETAMLYGIGILEEYRRNGYGRALVSMALDLAFANSGQVCLEVDSANPEALSLYRRVGFSVTFQVDYHRLQLS